MSPYLKAIREKVGQDLLILPSVTIIHFDDSNRMLLLKHVDTQNWVAPGGSIEPNETPADAAVREMWEETGLYVKLTNMIGVYGGEEFLVEYSNGDRCTYVMTVFECEVIDGELKGRDDEALELKYFSRDELKQINLSHWAKQVLPKLFDSRHQAKFEAPNWTPPDYK